LALGPSGVELPPGTRLVLTVTAVTDDTVTMVDAEGRLWQMPRRDDFGDARVGDVYDVAVRAKKPNPN